MRMNWAPAFDALREYGPMTASQICVVIEIEPTSHNVQLCTHALNNHRIRGHVEKNHIDGEVVWRLIE